MVSLTFNGLGTRSVFVLHIASRLAASPSNISWAWEYYDVEPRPFRITPYLIFGVVFDEYGFRVRLVTTCIANASSSRMSQRPQHARGELRAQKLLKCFRHGTYTECTWRRCFLAGCGICRSLMIRQFGKHLHVHVGDGGRSCIRLACSG